MKIIIALILVVLLSVSTGSLPVIDRCGTVVDSPCDR